MYLTPAELQQFRNDIAPLLTGTAVIWRPSDASDSQGGYRQTWVPVGTAPCRVEPIARISLGTEESGGIHPSSAKSFYVITPSGTDIRVIDRVRAYNTQYEVVGIRDPRTDEVTVRAECSVLGISEDIGAG